MLRLGKTQQIEVRICNFEGISEHQAKGKMIKFVGDIIDMVKNQIEKVMLDLEGCRVVHALRWLPEDDNGEEHRPRLALTDIAKLLSLSVG